MVRNSSLRITKKKSILVLLKRICIFNRRTVFVIIISKYKCWSQKQKVQYKYDNYTLFILWENYFITETANVIKIVGWISQHASRIKSLSFLCKATYHKYCSDFYPILNKWSYCFSVHQIQIRIQCVNNNKLPTVN